MTHGDMDVGANTVAYVDDCGIGGIAEDREVGQDAVMEAKVARVYR
jgi:hypothetical protein